VESIYKVRNSLSRCILLSSRMTVIWLSCRIVAAIEMFCSLMSNGSCTVLWCVDVDKPVSIGSCLDRKGGGSLARSLHSHAPPAVRSRYETLPASTTERFSESIPFIVVANKRT
jgi:hypothetical protein